ncbi:Rho termination factor N-terminal domain-containing protein [Pengzhenrongella frigida]|nr:Rho termination factor N-terminal domain-containing protein [Cellulomonas sp. HLT2-17]
MRDPGPAAHGERLAAALRAAPQADRADAGPLEDWTMASLRERASETGIEGRSRMRKDELIRALRAQG